MVVLSDVLFRRSILGWLGFEYAEDWARFMGVCWNGDSCVIRWIGVYYMSKLIFCGLVLVHSFPITQHTG